MSAHLLMLAHAHHCRRVTAAMGHSDEENEDAQVVARISADPNATALLTLGTGIDAQALDDYAAGVEGTVGALTEQLPAEFIPALVRSVVRNALLVGYHVRRIEMEEENDAG